MAMLRYLAGAILAATALAMPAAALAEEITGTARVRSGNEITLGDASLRLYGVAAPAPEALCDAGDGDIQCGIIAWAELIRLADGKELSCDIERRDKELGLIATCYFGEQDINEALVNSGWAEADDTIERYHVEQEEARRARRGMWAGKVRPPDRRQAP